jgi:hypothetical protein
MLKSGLSRAKPKDEHRDRMQAQVEQWQQVLDKLVNGEEVK